MLHAGLKTKDRPENLSRSPSPIGYGIDQRYSQSTKKSKDSWSSGLASSCQEDGASRRHNLPQRNPGYLSAQLHDDRGSYGRIGPQKYAKAKRPRTPAQEVGTRALSPYPSVVSRHNRSKKFDARLCNAIHSDEWKHVSKGDSVDSFVSTNIRLRALQENGKEQHGLSNYNQQACVQTGFRDDERDRADCSRWIEGSVSEFEAVNDHNQISVIGDSKSERVLITGAQTQDANDQLHTRYSPVASDKTRTSKLSWAQIARGDGSCSDGLENPISAVWAKSPTLVAKLSDLSAHAKSKPDAIISHATDSDQSGPRPFHNQNPSGSNTSLSPKPTNYSGIPASQSPDIVKPKARDSVRNAPGDMMQYTEEKVLLSLRQQSGSEKSATFSIGMWDIENFLQERYPQGLNQDLGSILTVTGTTRDAYLTTVRKYLAQMWPRHPTTMLIAIQDAISNAHLKDGTTRNRENKIHMSLMDHEVSISGTEDFIVVMAQQLVWFMTSLQSTTADLAYCRASLQENASQTNKMSSAFAIDTETYPILSSEARSCWNPLIKRSIIATGFPIPARFYNEVGLEIPLEIMACLGGTAIAVLYRGGYLLKGRSTMFLPVKRTPNSVQWHLIIQKEGTIDYKDAEKLCRSRLPEKKLRKKELLRTRAFLGWCTESSNKLATNELSYKDIGFSDVKEQNKRFFHVTGGTLAFAKAAASIGLNFTIGKSTAPYSMVECNVYQWRLQDAKDIHIILQDMQTRRAWHVDGERFILQIILHRQKEGMYSNMSELKMLDTDTVDYVRQMTTQNAEVVLVQESYGANTTPHKVLREVFSELCDRLQGMRAHLADSYLEEGRQRWNSDQYVQGYEYRAVLRGTERPTKKEVQLEESCGGWPAFARDISAIVVFGVNFGDVIQASPLSDLCPVFRRVPEENDYLVVEGSVLTNLFIESGAEENQHQLTCSGRQWRRSKYLFEPCPPARENDNDYCTCDRIQTLLPNTLRPFKSPKPPGRLPQNCAVIFGQGKRPARRIFNKVFYNTPNLTPQQPKAVVQQKTTGSPSTIESLPPKPELASSVNWQIEAHSQASTANHTPISDSIEYEEPPEDFLAIRLTRSSDNQKKRRPSAVTGSSPATSKGMSPAHSLSSSTTTMASMSTVSTPSYSISSVGDFGRWDSQQSTATSELSYLVDELTSQSRPLYSQVVKYPRPDRTKAAKLVYLPKTVDNPSAHKESDIFVGSSILHIESSRLEADKPVRITSHRSQHSGRHETVPSNQTPTSKLEPAKGLGIDICQSRVLTYAEALQRPRAPSGPTVGESRSSVPSDRCSSRPETTGKHSSRGYTITARKNLL